MKKITRDVCCLLFIALHISIIGTGNVRAQSSKLFTVKIKLSGLANDADGNLISDVYVAKKPPENLQAETKGTKNTPEIHREIEKNGTEFFSVIARWHSKTKNVELFLPALYIPKSNFPKSRALERAYKLMSGKKAFYETRIAAGDAFRKGNHLIGMHLLHRAMQSGYVTPGEQLKGAFEVLNSYRRDFKDERRALEVIVSILENNIDLFENNQEYVNYYLNFLANFALDQAHTIQIFSTELKDYRVSKITDKTRLWHESFPNLFRQIIRKHKEGRDFRGCVNIATHFLRFFDERETEIAANRSEVFHDSMTAVLVEGMNCLHKEYAINSDNPGEFNIQDFEKYTNFDPQFSSYREIFIHLVDNFVDLKSKTKNTKLLLKYFLAFKD